MDSQAPNTEERVELVESDQPALPEPKEDGSTSKTIYERLFEAHRIVGALGKESEAQIKKDGRVVGRYNYHSSDVVIARAKEVLVSVGVLAWPFMKEMTQGGNRTRVDVQVDFINVDNPTEKISTTSFAYGCDNQDKGPGKAYSYAVKNALLKALMISTSEDVEAHQVDFDDGQSAEVAFAKEETKSALEAWAGTFRAALKSAQSVEDVKRLEKENKSRLSSANLPSVTRDFFIDLIERRKEDLRYEKGED